MKILHTSDLHIGKRVNEFSLIEEQAFVLNQIIDIARRLQPAAIILSGDIYDKTVPSAEAVNLFDEFLVGLSRLGKAVFVISGNHDSPERIAFASRIMEAERIYLSRVYDGVVEPIVLTEGSTEVAFYLLPFVKPIHVAHFAGEEASIKSYQDAVAYAVERMHVDPNRRNVLVAHQFITDALRSESEDVIVGGLDNIDASVFEPFDYVALGHLHRPQCCGRPTVRYSGSPLKYSFSEVDDLKSLTLVDINGSEPPVVTTIPLAPLHEWFDLRGSYDELSSKEFYDGRGYQDAFVRITLTDEEDIPDAMRKLRAIYHRLMELRYDNKRTRLGSSSVDRPLNVNLSPETLFAELFQKQNAQPMSTEQQQYVEGLINQIFRN